ncbi:diacylglycerol kinase (ATP) [Pedobacter insulae]|uniref:Diacylglycerol kinase (ATP) n=2 Tax=Pedobacter insulae TaxID=414048 RepID=A0A1I2TJJ7_9SPHI|nr:diacylglycerol kinase (ATP) [Pedobacter insulae]
MKALLNSFVYAFNGLVYAFKTQLNFKIHCVAALLIVALGWWVGLSNTEWPLIVIAIGLVIVAELFNTGIEVLVDLVSPQQHPKAGAVKDIAAAAVLISAIIALAIALFIFVPKFV